MDVIGQSMILLVALYLDADSSVIQKKDMHRDIDNSTIVWVFWALHINIIDITSIITTTNIITHFHLMNHTDLPHFWHGRPAPAHGFAGSVWSWAMRTMHVWWGCFLPTGARMRFGPTSTHGTIFFRRIYWSSSVRWATSIFWSWPLDSSYLPSATRRDDLLLCCLSVLLYLCRQWRISLKIGNVSNLINRRTAARWGVLTVHQQLLMDFHVSIHAFKTVYLFHSFMLFPS